jgi:hypothetical protein
MRRASGEGGGPYPAHDQAQMHARRAEGGVGGLGHIRSGDRSAFLVHPESAGAGPVGDRHPGGLGNSGDRPLHRLVLAHRHREPHPSPAAGQEHLLGVEAKVRPQRQRASGTGLPHPGEGLAEETGGPANSVRPPPRRREWSTSPLPARMASKGW